MTLRLSTEGLAQASARRPWLVIGAWVAGLLVAGVAVVALLGDALTTDDDFTNTPESKRADALLERGFDQQGGHLARLAGGPRARPVRPVGHRARRRPQPASALDPAPSPPTHGSHLPERWGLFTIIAFGESVVAVALGTSATEFEVSSAVAAALGFLAVACLWWVYFDKHEGLMVEGTSPAMVIYS